MASAYHTKRGVLEATYNPGPKSVTVFQNAKPYTFYTPLSFNALIIVTTSGAPRSGLNCVLAPSQQSLVSSLMVTLAIVLHRARRRKKRLEPWHGELNLAFQKC